MPSKLHRRLESPDPARAKLPGGVLYEDPRVAPLDADPSRPRFVSKPSGELERESSGVGDAEAEGESSGTKWLSFMMSGSRMLADPSMPGRSVRRGRTAASRTGHGAGRAGVKPFGCESQLRCPGRE